MGDTILLTVTDAPAIHNGRTVYKDCWRILLTLLPAAAAAVTLWGFPALRVMALAVATGVGTEALCQKLMGRTVMVRDFTAVVSCLTLAFLFPASAPWWLVMLGAFLAIALGKMVFGGLGAHPFNAALVGWAMLAVSWPTLMAPNAMQLDTLFVDPLIQLKWFGAGSLDTVSLWKLFFGQQIGGLGATQGFLLLVGGLAAVALHLVRWEIPAGFFGGVFIASLLPWVFASSTNASPFFHLVTGSTLLGGFFLATEWSSSPSGHRPMLIYGMFAGVMVIVIRKFGMYPDGVPFAILLANLVAPLLDDIKPRPFGLKGGAK